MKISSISSEAIQIQLDGEDYSVADIVHKELLGIKRVKFAGVAPPHPLIKTLTIQVHTDGGDNNEVLKEAVNKAQERTREILEAIQKQFPNVVKPVKTPQTSDRSKESITLSAQIQPEEEDDREKTRAEPGEQSQSASVAQGSSSSPENREPQTQS
jgi:DNA-directed RNA polymerase subunit L